MHVLFIVKINDHKLPANLLKYLFQTWDKPWQTKENVVLL